MRSVFIVVKMAAAKAGHKTDTGQLVSLSELGAKPDLWRRSLGEPLALGDIARMLDEGPGFAVVRGIQFDDLEDARRSAIRLARQFGQPIWQDELGTLAWVVRDEGARLMRGNEIIELRGKPSSRSNEAIWFHTDGAAGWLGQDVDVMLLLAVHTDTQGGDSTLLDSQAAFRALLSEDPAAAAKLSQPLPFDRSTNKLPEQPDVTWLPMFSWERSRFRARLNPARVRASIASGIEADEGVLEALDALDEIMQRPELQMRFHLEDGDCLLTDERRIAHGRTAFLDPDRTLVRVWVHRPPATMVMLNWPVDMG